MDADVIRRHTAFAYQYGEGGPLSRIEIRRHTNHFIVLLDV